MRLPPPFSRTTAIAAVIIPMLSCSKDTSSPTVPASVSVAPAAVTFGAVGSTRQLTATVKDANGGTLSGVTVTWSTNNPAVALVSSSGVVTSSGSGTTAIVATVSGSSIKGSATVSVAQVPVLLRKVVGDAQHDTVGQQLPLNIVVEVDDSLFSPVGNIAITFAVTSGGGSVATPSTQTNASGQATTTWKLGTVPGSNQVTATAAAGATTPVAFTATAVVAKPKTVQLQSGDGQTGSAGTDLTNPVVVLVSDTFNNVVPGAVVKYSVTGGGGRTVQPNATTNASGLASMTWTLGAAGSNTLNATVVGSGITGNPVAFTATATANGTPKGVAVFAGDAQTGLTGYPLNFAPAVIVSDSAGHPVSGAMVTFAVTSGGGSVSGPTVSTDNFGVATVGGWTVMVGSNGLSATVTGSGIAGNPVNFTATGATANFKIDIRFLSTMSSAESTAFLQAKAKWESIIYQQVAVWHVQSGPGACGSSSPTLDTTNVTGVIIFASIVPIDGPGQILGQAGPCVIRNAADRYLPALGLMQFDSVDVPAYVAAGRFGDLILHEMGHVLGYGVLWGSSFQNLLVNPALQGNPDPYFNGPLANAAFYQVGGGIYTGGAVVPVENTGGQGTADAHWRESVFKSELMTGYYNGGVTNPLSVVSIASMGDMGYTVNYAAADPYVLSWPLRAAPLEQVHLVDDIVHVPIRVTNPDGSVVRIVNP